MDDGSAIKPARVTMQDVAREAGVSQTTVSFVLNGNEDVRIGDQTRDRVLEVVARLGYLRRPNVTARARGTTAPFIGFMVDEISTSIFAAISIEGAQEAAWDAGYVLDVAMTNSNPAYEKTVLNRWVEDGVAGVIYGSILTRRITPPKLLNSINAVLLNCHSDDRPFAAVVPSEILGGFAATEALVKCGCKRIAFIGGEEWMEAATERRQGYRNALASYNIHADETLIRPGNFLPSGGYEATKDLLDLPEPPDGIFCANDLAAIGVYEALKESGKRIPEDIAVVGYDDQEIARHLNPPLSSVLLPHREMGIWAVNWLLTEGTQGDRAPTTFRLECPLVSRASCPSQNNTELPSIPTTTSS